MIDPGEYLSLIDRAGPVPQHTIASFLPAQSHPLFGAGFLLLGALLLVETLAGGVWFRSRLRTLIWPAALVVLGLCMLVVTYADPHQKPVHLLLAALFIVGGVLESRYRLRQMPRLTADMFVVPALFLGGIMIGPIHAAGEMTTAWGQRHMLMGLTGMALAAVRLRQAFQPTSAPIAAGFGTLVMVLGLELLLSSGHSH